MQLELLSPAKNAEIGIEAIRHGADAVYIGAPKFGARQAAGNSLNDIERLLREAHLYGAKVLVTLNTILDDQEIREAETLVHQLYNIGVDALIIQDMGLLRLDLPPIRLHASTQANNLTTQQVSFLEKCGFARVVLARELSLQQIAEIKANTSIELEAFVHGALCVSYSGQCYLSQALCQRSANRGACAQLCRLPYDLVDARGQKILQNKHLLSLKDMDRSNYLWKMAQAGVTSFKIEGRLKDVNYVKNVVSHYRQKLDQIMLEHPHLTPASCGKVTHFFEPCPAKTFHRGQTDYFLTGERTKIAQWDTPKSTGERVGEIIAVDGKQMKARLSTELHNGDGLCYVSEKGLNGFRVNTLQGGTITTITTLTPLEKTLKGTPLLRNYDQRFETILTQKTAERKLPIQWTLSVAQEGFSLQLSELTRNKTVTVLLRETHTPAQQPERMAETIRQQLANLGDTPFVATNTLIHQAENYFLPASRLNAARRDAVAQMIEALATQKPTPHVRHEKEHQHYATSLSYAANVYNRKAQDFYQEHGVTTIEPAFELKPLKKARLMTCKYCLRYEMGICPKHHPKASQQPTYPLFLQHGNQRLQLHFDCHNCEMYITSPE